MADRTIEITNIKGINSLVFQVPSSGVHVITGPNGCGKTTLLACLQRLSWSYAFQWYFKTSPASNLDAFQGSISYENANRRVTYSYGSARWVPTPRSHKDVLGNFGFNDVKFISTSSSQRFYVQEQELTTARIDPASQFIRNNLNRIFGLTKYSELRKTRVDTSRRRGAHSRDNIAYIIPRSTNTRPYSYYSEKNFSLGEILILNMLEQIESLQNNSLLLIDEIELALHPKVQIELYRFLTEMARQKDLTILISSHSTSLIKNCENLIYLKRNHLGAVQVISRCSPAYALGELAYDEDVIPDAIFYVEDRNGKILMDQMLKYYWQRNTTRHRLDIRIVYVGGYRQVTELMNQSRGYLFHSNLKTKAFLDADVQTETIPSLNNTNPFIVSFNQLRSDIDFLPCTPELGICGLLETNVPHHDSEIS